MDFEEYKVIGFDGDRVILGGEGNVAKAYPVVLFAYTPQLGDVVKKYQTEHYIRFDKKYDGSQTAFSNTANKQRTYNTAGNYSTNKTRGTYNTAKTYNTTKTRSSRTTATNKTGTYSAEKNYREKENYQSYNDKSLNLEYLFGNIGGEETTQNTYTSYTPVYDRKVRNKWVSFFLCLCLGYLGVHKFYEGKVGWGIGYLFTGGLLGFGWLVDVFRHGVKLFEPGSEYYVD